MPEKEHKGLPVHGYRTQSVDKVETVNAHKIEEERLLRRVEAMMADDAYDVRWLAIAKTHFQQGFMALNRAVFRPARVKLPEDDASAEDLRLLGDSD